MRRAFAEILTRAAADNPRVIFLTGDLGFQVFDDFRGRFGSRYVNVGVAEAQLVCAAAGLALEGWRPVVYSIASFMTGRAFEQIRISVNYPCLPVIVVGAGGGYTYASSGVTHHAADDLGLMSILPNMTVVAPGDQNEVTHLFPQLLQLPGPCYFRIGRFGELSYDAALPAMLGRARILSEGAHVAIVCTGDIAPVVMHAVKILNAEGIHPATCQMHTVKPLDADTLDGLAVKTETIIVVEEHVPNGGLWSAVTDWAARRRQAPSLIRLGPPDRLLLGNPQLNEVRHQFQYDCAGNSDSVSDRLAEHSSCQPVVGKTAENVQMLLGEYAMNEPTELGLITFGDKTENRRRSEFLELFRKCPIPDEEYLHNLGLFLTPQTLSRILFMDYLYRQTLSVQGVVVEFGCRWGQNLSLFTALRGIYEPFNRLRKVIGFDTFEGLSGVSKEDGQTLKQGMYSVTPGYEQYLKKVLDFQEQECPLAHLKKYDVIRGDASVCVREYLCETRRPLLPSLILTWISTKQRGIV